MFDWFAFPGIIVFVLVAVVSFACICSLSRLLIARYRRYASFNFIRTFNHHHTYSATIVNTQTEIVVP